MAAMLYLGLSMSVSCSKPSIRTVTWKKIRPNCRPFTLTKRPDVKQIRFFGERLGVVSEGTLRKLLDKMYCLRVKSGVLLFSTS